MWFESNFVLNGLQQTTQHLRLQRRRRRQPQRQQQQKDWDFLKLCIVHKTRVSHLPFPFPVFLPSLSDCDTKLKNFLMIKFFIKIEFSEQYRNRKKAKKNRERHEWGTMKIMRWDRVRWSSFPSFRLEKKTFYLLSVWFVCDFRSVLKVSQCKKTTCCYLFVFVPGTILPQNTM